MAIKFNFEDFDKEIVCQSLTFGYIYDVDKGLIAEDKLDIVENGSNLSFDEIKTLLKTQVDELYVAIRTETYPESDNVEDDEEDKDKKKL